MDLEEKQEKLMQQAPTQIKESFGKGQNALRFSSTGRCTFPLLSCSLWLLPELYPGQLLAHWASAHHCYRLQPDQGLAHQGITTSQLHMLLVALCHNTSHPTPYEQPVSIFPLLSFGGLKVSSP